MGTGQKKPVLSVELNWIQGETFEKFQFISVALTMTADTLPTRAVKGTSRMSGEGTYSRGSPLFPISRPLTVFKCQLRIVVTALVNKEKASIEKQASIVKFCEVLFTALADKLPTLAI